MDTQTVTPTKPTHRSRVTNGSRILAEGDGRSVWSRRFRDLIELHVADLGGAQACSEAQLSLVRRAAALEVTLEGMECEAATNLAKFSIEVYGRSANSLRRILESLGLKRVARETQSPLVDHFARGPVREAAR